MQRKLGLNRRQFSHSLVGGIAGFSLLTGCSKRMVHHYGQSNPSIVLPHKLQIGDRIGLIAPASYADNEKISKSISNLQSFGLTVVEGKYLRKKNGFIAGTDGERVEDLHEMFRRKDIDGIWCVRGGYGTTRILDMLDYSLIRSNPKIFIGYSDITALHQAFYTQAGLVSFHGPVASSDITTYARESIIDALFDGDYSYSIRPFWDQKERKEPFRVLRSGQAEGVLVGGNLSLLSALCGTPYMPDLTGKIVFIEDVGEASYRYDRMLVQLIQAANLNKASAIIFGNCKNCEQDGDSDDQTIPDVIQSHFIAQDIPLVTGYSVGHINDQATFGIGMSARFDADSGILQFVP